MPELPEVETTVRDLRKKILKRIFFNVWTDAKGIIKKPSSFESFKKELIGNQILDVKRRGKNILFFLSSGKILLVHQKLTGHLLFGKWQRRGKEWISEIEGPLKEDPMNRFLHLIFFFRDGWQLALSDVRKFAKVEILEKNCLEKELKKIGPEPLEANFTFQKFEEIFRKRKGKIKKVLMDQKVIAGIGNIYSDEILWQARIHPFKNVEKLKKEELERIYRAMREILSKAIEVGGESISDFRRPSGEKGKFDFLRKVYRREGEKCSRCGWVIERRKINGRSAHFCPQCQKS